MLLPDKIDICCHVSTVQYQKYCMQKYSITIQYLSTHCPINALLIMRTRGHMYDVDKVRCSVSMPSYDGGKVKRELVHLATYYRLSRDLPFTCGWRTNAQTVENQSLCALCHAIRTPPMHPNIVHFLNIQ